jgi:uncharacterized membrane protein YoaK (UPF0700 family)
LISKLPRWVWSGAWLLSFIAGIVNIVGLLGFRHQAVTHLTGTTSLMAATAADGDVGEALHLLAVILAFLAGAVLSGFLIQDSALRLGRRYGLALLIESAMLAAAVPLLNRQHLFGIYLASCACGLQNALASTYSGAVVRTTHLSGMFTDLGIVIGQRLRGLQTDRRRAYLCLTIVSGFFLGGIVGTFIFNRLGYSTLLIPSGLTAIVAIGYTGTARSSASSSTI